MARASTARGAGRSTGVARSRDAETRDRAFATLPASAGLATVTLRFARGPTVFPVGRGRDGIPRRAAVGNMKRGDRKA